MVNPLRLAHRPLDRMVVRQRVSVFRLAWLDCRALEYCSAVDKLGWMHGQDDSNDCFYRDCEWYRDCGNGVWTAGPGCQH